MYQDFASELAWAMRHMPRTRSAVACSMAYGWRDMSEADWPVSFDRVLAWQPTHCAK